VFSNNLKKSQCRHRRFTSLLAVLEFLKFGNTAVSKTSLSEKTNQSLEKVMPGAMENYFVYRYVPEIEKIS
jgi:hypothetical protein